MYKIIVEYIWLDNNYELRSKSQILNIGNRLPEIGIKPNDLPIWNYDGSSTGQAIGNKSEIIIKPRAIYRCPFRRSNYNHAVGYLVMCDTYNTEDLPTETNKRHAAEQIFNKNLEEKPWYGIEQEYFIINNKTKLPLGFTENEEPNAQGQYYCSVGSRNAFGRELIEMHYEFCLYAGLMISGINSEVAPGQWEYQIGPVEGIEAGDQLYISRYILHRISEIYNVHINIHPKPIAGDWNGSGCHTNYSTLNMREGTTSKKGLEYINEAINKLSLKHDEHMEIYGTDNNLRMTGKHETAAYDKFSHGVANRGVSIRIPTSTFKNEKGYFEDRRPASNMEPYLVTSKLFETTILN
jgi:glutamine synthetase